LKTILKEGKFKGINKYFNALLETSEGIIEVTDGRMRNKK
jgi:hypothetical protein